MLNRTRRCIYFLSDLENEVDEQTNQLICDILTPKEQTAAAVDNRSILQSELSKEGQKDISAEDDENESQDGDESSSLEVGKNTVSLSLGIIEKKILFFCFSSNIFALLRENLKDLIL